MKFATQYLKVARFASTQRGTATPSVPTLTHSDRADAPGSRKPSQAECLVVYQPRTLPPVITGGLRHSDRGP
jgi:hypothetical protein